MVRQKKNYNSFSALVSDTPWLRYLPFQHKAQLREHTTAVTVPSLEKETPMMGKWRYSGVSLLSKVDVVESITAQHRAVAIFARWGRIPEGRDAANDGDV